MMSVGKGTITALGTFPAQFCPGTICAVKLIGPSEFDVVTSIPVLTNASATSCRPAAKYWSTMPLASLDEIWNVFSGERFIGALTERVNVSGSQLSIFAVPGIPDPGESSPAQLPFLVKVTCEVTTPGTASGPREVAELFTVTWK